LVCHNCGARMEKGARFCTAGGMIESESVAVAPRLY